MSNHYQTLGLNESASREEIKKAYFDLAKKYHPDSGDESEVKKFHELTTAYKTLSDEELKNAYDQTLEVGMEKIQHAEEELTKKNPVDPNLNRQKRETYRDEELKEYHKNRLRNAQLRVVISSLIFSLIGAFLGVLLDHPSLLTGVAGLLIGFSTSMQKNFELDSFFDHPKKQKRFQLFLKGLFIFGILYFVGVIIFSML